jgi:hypothetical protein
MLRLHHPHYHVTITDDPQYRYPASNPVMAYDHVHLLGDPSYLLTHHAVHIRVRQDTVYSCIVLANGGVAAVHPDIALLLEETCLVAVGNSIVALSLPTTELLWGTVVDAATCFGVYYSATYDWFVSHGECAIAAVARDGTLRWSTSGKDIFTNGFVLHDHTIEVVDFNGELYAIEIGTGRSTIIA